MLSCFGRVRLCATLWTIALQAPLSMVFSRQEYWSGLPFPSPGDLPNPGIEPRSSTLQVNSLPSESPGKPFKLLGFGIIYYAQQETIGNYSNLEIIHTWKLFKLFLYNDMESLHSPCIKMASSQWIKTASVSFKGCSLVCYFRILNHSCFTHGSQELLSHHLPKTRLLISVFCLPELSLARMSSAVAAVQHTFHFSFFH